MRVQQILEAVAEDYFRKIEALDAMMTDRATTANEKQSAANLKAKIEQKLAAEFPNAKRSPKSSMDSDEFAAARAWADEFARQQAEYDRYENAKKPGANRDFIRDKIERLKTQRKEALVQQAWGDVYAIRDVKELSAKIDRLYAEYFPEEWAEIEAKREANNARAAERAHEKRKEKVATMKAAADESGLSFSTAAKGHDEVLKKIYKLITGKAYSPRGYGGVLSTSTFYHLAQAGTKELRTAFAKLSPEEQVELRDIVKSIHTVGHVGYSYDEETNNGYTEAQKQKVLKGMDLVKSANGIPFKDLVAKWNPLLKGYQRRPSRYGFNDPIKDVVTFIGQEGSKGGKAYNLTQVQQMLDDQQIADFLADVKRVNPTTPKEETYLFNLKALLTPEGQSDGLSWDQFKEKFADTIESIKYKRERWEKKDSLFDIFGKAPSTKWTEQTYRDAINKLAPEQKSEILSGLAEVSPKNAMELARVKRLKSYLE